MRRFVNIRQSAPAASSFRIKVPRLPGISMLSATIISDVLVSRMSRGSHVGNRAIENNPSGLPRFEIRTHVRSETWYARYARDASSTARVRASHFHSAALPDLGHRPGM